MRRTVMVRFAQVLSLVGAVLAVAPMSAVAQRGEVDPVEVGASLPGQLPLFPLPDVALLEGQTLPLHVFEPRYLTMVEDVLAGDGLIGMVMLRPGFEVDYEGRPPVYSVGGAGLIEDAERLQDGRYIIVLRGIAKFRITGEDHGLSYRVATVEAIPEEISREDAQVLAERRGRLEELLIAVVPGSEFLFESLGDEDFVLTATQLPSLRPSDRQMLLEAEGSLARADRLVELLEGMLPAPR